MSVVAVVNPLRIGDPAALQTRMSTAAEQYDLGELTWIETTVDDTGTAAAQRAAAGGAKLVVVCGGDGTVRNVAAGLLDTGIPLGIIASGTGNLLVRNLGVPLDSTGAIGTVFGGNNRKVDVLDVSLGRGQHEISLVMCGMGWDAAMMAVSDRVKARLGWGAYAVQAARTVRDHPIRLRVQVDDGPEGTFYARTCLIANVGTLVGGMVLFPDAQPDDGRLEVLVFDPTTAADYVRSSWGVVRGQGSDGDPARTVLRGQKVVVTTHRARPRQIDGDIREAGHGFIVRVLPGALTVRVPSVVA